MQFFDTTVLPSDSRSARSSAGGDETSYLTIRDGRASKASAKPSHFLRTNGGTMRRFLTVFIVLLGLAGLTSQAGAQWLPHISGYLNAGQTKVFYPRVPGNSALDTIYKIDGDYHVAGTLIIMEGAEVHFLPNSRIIDSTGGKIIANGFTGLNRRIQFRGESVNPNSYEWGHFLILPGADSCFFANVRFALFKKRTSVDVTFLYGTVGQQAANGQAINNAANGNGAVITTFSAKTWIEDAIVDSCQTSYRGGAFAFLQAPVNSYFPNDDGRLALANSQVRRLTIRDTRCYNGESGGGAYPDVNALGGAIYMASNGGASATYLTAFLGNQKGPFFADSQDVMLFERCSANNTGGASNFAKGGAIYVGTKTGLVIERATFNNDSAIMAHPSLDLNTWGGAIALSSTSAQPGFNLPPPVGGVLPQPTPGTITAGLTILKTASFNGCVAGLGGAIQIDFVGGVSYPYLNIDAENIMSGTGIRDSGMISFNGNVGYYKGGAIYTSSPIFVKGYLAPQNFPWPGGAYPVEMRVKYFNNVAGVGGGAVYLSTAGSGYPAIVNRRVWYLQNSVNCADPRINAHATYGLMVEGGGAEYVGRDDSTFATEYTGNFVQGGNGGAVLDYAPTTSGNANAVSRYWAEDGFNAQNITATPYPFDPRQLTRFLNNHCYLGTAADSAVLFTNVGGNPHGRGGAMYISNGGTTSADSTILSRVRMEQNYAYSGSALWCATYDMRILSNLCLIANNHTTGNSILSAAVDLNTSGALKGISNPEDVNASATIWGDFEGGLPSYESNSRGDAIYDNTARYILRLPSAAPLSGRSGADTLRGLFWGETGPGILTQINPPTGSEQATFFLDFYKGCFGNVYEPNRNPPSSYTPAPIGQIPDTLLMEGRVYDLYDQGTDMKVADYANRRMAPAEAFSLGLPSDVVRLHRWTRDIFNTDPTYVSKIDLYQTDMTGPHPIGYPLFLQADVSTVDSNRDNYARNFSVLIVQNTTTGEFVRVNAKETVQDEGLGPQQIYQGRLDFVPDSTIAKRTFFSRQKALYTLSLLRPATMSYFEIQRASKLEDSAALDGRQYSLAPSDMMGTTAGDTICNQGVLGTSTWYAGERYHTLPVRPGDKILVISRTLLWKYGAQYATSHGLQFVIGDVSAPQFTNDIPNLATDQYQPNRRFIHEDVNYDASDLAHTLFRVGGYDPNNFYDPRFLFNQGMYTQLAYNVSYDLLPGDPDTNHVRLYKWLKQSTVFNQNVIGSNGYVLLTGQPHNADVVPSGEGVTATVTNFPPNSASEMALRNAGFGAALGADSLQLSLWSFPPYMNWNTPGCAQPGFEPDTLCVRSTATTYHFRIFVMDSLPRFTSTAPPACWASLTDSLRYTYDINTDDEAEDAAAAAETPEAWDFRYGRTSYRFLTRPSWMKFDAGSGKYGQIDTLSPASRAANFTQKGIINVRIDSAYAVKNLLTPTPQVNGELNFDTIIAVEAHDGHTGKSVSRWNVQVNIAPAITTDTLPDAKEGFDYSLNFEDTTKVTKINIYDPNYADYHTYQLVYEGDTQTVYRDPNYGVGKTLLTGTTPRWLHIDPYSGVLTGTPLISDAPRTATTNCGSQDTVMIVVQDQCHLTTWKTLLLSVDSVQHPPSFVKGPHDICVTNHIAFCDSVKVQDKDLLRPGCIETITITSLDTAYKVTPGTAVGTLSNDTVTIHVCSTPNKDDSYFSTNPPPADSVHLLVTDAAGNTNEIVYAIHIGDAPTFSCFVDVYNVITATHPLQDVQRLCFGAGRFGTDSLDIRYCEMEVPPSPYAGVFDARWELPIGGQIEGTYIDIRRDVTTGNAPITWQVKFQSGNEGGQSGNLFPMDICWRPSCMDPAKLPAGTFKTGHFYLRHPQNPQEFSVNMFNGGGPVDPSLYTLLRVGSDSMVMRVRDSKLANALIVFVPANSGVEQTAAPVSKFALEPSHPNPFSSATTIDFSVAERSTVRIAIYDVKGTLVRTLVGEQLDPGTYPVTWDGTDANGQEMANGSYIVQMTAGSFTSSQKMILNRQ